MVKKIFSFLFIFFMLCFSCYALDFSSVENQIDDASDKISGFLGHSELRNMIIVTGSKISIEDKMLFNMIKSNVPGLDQVEVVSDDYLEEHLPEGKTLVFLGSDRTNRLAKEFVDGDVMRNRTLYDPLNLELNIKDDQKFIMIYSQKEIVNNENVAIKNSPLNNIVPEEYVPVAATVSSIALLYIWNILQGVITDFVNETITSKIVDRKTKGKKIKKKKVHEVKAHEFINIHEVIAFVITVIVYSFVMTWTWLNDSSNFWPMLRINLFAVFAVFFSRELIRLVFCYKHKLRSEYVFWPMGTALTLISTWLGSTFSLSSYTLLEEDDADEKVFGKGSFMVNVISFLAAGVAYVFNIIYPSLFLQMFFVSSLMILFIEMFPLAPMAGADIRRWNLLVYILSYGIIFAGYIFVNFTVYV